jgi:23S rRNA (cytosine1962-C5)-methyltransferase
MGNDCLTNLINAAFDARAELVKMLESDGTDTWRLFHGVNEGRPGLTIDRYGPQVLIQDFRQPLSPPEIKEIKTVVSFRLGFSPYFVYKNRGEKKLENIPVADDVEAENSANAAKESTPMVCREMGVNYRVIGAHRGLDPLLFIDLRAARRFVKENCKGKSVLNLFAYTCGVGVAAAVAGARKVWNVDFAQSALNYGKENAALNHLPEDKIRFINQDVFPVIRQLSGLGVKGKARRRRFLTFKPATFDIVFMDPPTWAKSRFGAVDIINDYQGLFKPALLCVKPGGMIICTNHAPSVDLEDWLEQLRRCAEKAGRPIKHSRVIEPESDFPSPDNKFPLKIAGMLPVPKKPLRRGHA